MATRSFASRKSLFHINKTTYGIELVPSEKHKGTIVWIHGLGDSSEGFRDLFEEMIAPKVLDGLVKIVLPDAPMRPVSLNGGMVMQAWYDIEALRKTEDTQGIVQSAEIISKILDHEASIISSSNIVIGGFSQGGAMASYCGLQYPKPLAGITSCSGYLLDTFLKKEFSSGISKQNEKTPFLIFHGQSDPMVPYDWAMKGYQRLKKEDVQFIKDPTQQHEVTMPQIQKLISWFNEVLQKKF